MKIEKLKGVYIKVAEKNLKARIVHKHDTETNWLLATGFTPKQGEIIVYDIDDTYSYERFKIGDGIRNVNELPFATNRSLKVTVSRDSDGNNVVDKTYQEIYDAVSVGAYVYMVTGNTIYVDGYSVWPNTILRLTYCSDYSVQFAHNDGTSECDVEVDNDNQVSLYYTSALPSQYSYGYEGMVLTVGENGVVSPADFPDTIARVSAVEEVKTLIGDASVSEQINTAALNNQSDWSTNDETSPNYVKNRTHYRAMQDLVTIDDSNITLDAYDNLYRKLYEGHTFPNLGETVRITFNGNTYSFIASHTDNSYLVFDTMGDTDEELLNGTGTYGFSLSWQEWYGHYSYFYTNVETVSDFKVVIEHDTYVQLPEEYIAYKPGRVVTGKKFTIDDEEVVAIDGAEVFNDYDNNAATGGYSHAEGGYTVASGYYAHAEGQSTTASGQSSHAEGVDTVASGTFAHAEGQDTTASGSRAHAEGTYTVASGVNAHAEGGYAVAGGISSHAEGHETIASSDYQHVQGQYNVEDAAGKYAHIVGNGTSNKTRSNAHTIDWSGNTWFKGAIKIGGVGYDDESAKELATKDYVGTLVGDTTVSEQIATAILNNKPKIASITLSAPNWTGDTNPWSQDMTVNGVTVNSKIDLQPTALQIVDLQNDEVTLMMQNDNGVVTAWAIGNKPTKDYTMQVLITEVVRV